MADVLSQDGKIYMRRKNRFRLISGLLLLVIGVCLINIGREYSLSAKHKRYQKKLENALRISEIAGNMVEGIESPADNIKLIVQPEEYSPNMSLAEEPERVMLTKFSALYEENQDIVGWLSVPGTVINYPVVQCEDN